MVTSWMVQLAIRQHKSLYQPCLIKHVLISFDNDDAENILLTILMYFQIVRRYIYNGFQKSKSTFGFWSHRQTIFWVISHTRPTLQDDDIA